MTTRSPKTLNARLKAFCGPVGRQTVTIAFRPEMGRNKCFVASGWQWQSVDKRPIP